MEYKFLSAWVEQNKFKNLIFQDLLLFRDQYAVKFARTGNFLQINLASEGCFCFFSDKKKIPFKSAKSLNRINYELKGSCLNEIKIAEKDRIIFSDFSYLDMENHLKEYRLIIELIPRFQNIILTQKEASGEYLILDAIRKISFADNLQRQILPNQKYKLPDSKYDNETDEIILPVDFNDQGKIKTSDNKRAGYLRINSLFEDLFYEVILKNRINKLQDDARKKVLKSIEKKEKKNTKLMRELEETGREKTWKKWADLLKINLKKVKPGNKIVTVIDYFSEEQKQIEIPLFPELTPQGNVQLYYKKYRKARDGKKMIREQIRKTRQEIEELKNSLNDIPFMETYLNPDEKSAAPAKVTGKFRTLKIDSDWEIFIGRTSSENDFLTTRFAKSDDWWFHTRIFKGTHIILRNYNKKELPERLLNICCRIAAYYSKAKKSANVPVDYTQIRYVRKPRKSPPGYVIYSNQKTLYVDPLSLRDGKKEIEKWKKK
ncbi:MAG: hypothetical protein APR54_06895 [Candidatus Cloacimonas sp. SDB]|nr:MAG: hypothetical protein APR54_06895 [Candidatus Cloacimonas sp. SDB]